MLPSQYLRKGWTQHEFAKDRANNIIEPHDKKAYKWCMLGSLDASYHCGGITSNIREEIEQELLNEIDYDFIEDYNDDENRKHIDVIAIMSKIEKQVFLKYKTNPHYNRFK